MLEERERGPLMLVVVQKAQPCQFFAAPRAPLHCKRDIRSTSYRALQRGQHCVR